MANELTAAQRQARVSVVGITGEFSTFTGGDTSADTTDVWPGGTTFPEKLGSPATTDDVVVSRPFKVSRDQPLLQSLTPKVGRWRTTVSRQWTDEDLVPLGKPDVYPEALLTKVARAEYDASSGDPGMLELTFSVARTV